MNRDQFSRIEERIEQLVEGGFARLFGNRLLPREVAVKLARAVEDNIQETTHGQLLAPTIYSVFLNPDDLAALLQVQPDLAALLADTVIDLAHRAELRLDASPTVELKPDDSLPLRDIRVTARYFVGELRSTQALTPLTSQPAPEAKPRSSHLILQGTRYIPLDRPVMNIGRKRDNHIVIDDARVSRRHAQIRLRFGRFVLYDLGSSGGTYVNNHRITECILRPGDVISLAGPSLVYVEDDTNPSYTNLASDTQLRPPTKTAPDNDPTV